MVLSVKRRKRKLAKHFIDLRMAVEQRVILCLWFLCPTDANRTRKSRRRRKVVVFNDMKEF